MSTKEVKIETFSFGVVDVKERLMFDVRDDLLFRPARGHI